jgi:hypothetical protein
MTRVRQSLLASHERCERRAWYAMHDVANKPHAGVGRGATVHAILDARAKGEPAPRDIDPALHRVADALAALVPSTWRLIGTEIPFIVDGPAMEIEGTIDALYEDGSPWRLVLCDRKTLHTLPSKARRDIRMLGPQPFLYGFAVLSITGNESLRVEYHFAARPKKDAQKLEPIRTCIVDGSLTFAECFGYVASCIPRAHRLWQIAKLPVYQTSVNTQACFDFGGCAYRDVCVYGPKPKAAEVSE